MNFGISVIRLSTVQNLSWKICWWFMWVTTGWNISFVIFISGTRNIKLDYFRAGF